MVNFDQIVFKNKKFSDILEDIYKKNKEKTKQIDSLVTDLKPLIKNLNDASLVVPLIKDYIDVGVRNDEILVKLAQIVQRAFVKEDGINTNDFGLSDEEMKKIEKEMQDLNEKKLIEIGNDLKEITNKIGAENEKKSESVNTEG